MTLRPGARGTAFLLRVGLAGALLGLPAPGPAGAQTRGGPEYDVVIRNGRVLDGAGNPWILADVAIRDGRFARVGVVEGRGIREIDATGRYVSPGWIDMMDQSGTTLLYNPLAENKLRMGVTTAIGGEGGTPALPQDRNQPRRGVSTASIPAYFQALEDSAISINFGTYYSQTQARVAVLGSSARAPTAEELARMRAAMDSAMKAGVLGMTTALIYPPSSYATTDELMEVARAMAPLGGIYASHIRGEGKELVEAVREAIEIGERAGVPVEIFHLKAAYQPGWGTLMREAIDTVNAARARGVDVAADLYPYTAGGTGLEATIPSWAHEGGQDSLRARLADPETRALLKRQVGTGVDGWWNIVDASGGWENIVLVNARNADNARFEGMSIAQIAGAEGRDPIDTAWDLTLAGSGRVMAIYHMMSEEDIITALGQPWVSIGSDAGAALRPGTPDILGLPHPRSYGTHPRVLTRYVRELGVLSLPEAIRRMTSWPATRMRLADRGVIREGLLADVVVFDFEGLDDRATYEAPTAFPVGIDFVLVNGVVTIEHGRHTGARAGHVLYGPGRR
ncbi:MAG: D-aminoacylase [Chloroflexi bacterium]|nr:D-aminoacylase [Gemmatimonadota bacterium]MDA1009842.1 D-aminoacylase [Chloroflexota bacterium]